MNRRPLWSAVREAKPWQFPFRLNRLIVAAVSAMLVMIMTAEVWDLALSQSEALLSALPFFSIGSTSVYVLIRQGLILRRKQSVLSEQTVLTNVATMAIVCLGMLSTFLVLFASTLIFGWMFFPESLISQWAGSVTQVSLGAYPKLASFIASLSMFLAGLGANFEERAYFRHVTLVDEEI